MKRVFIYSAVGTAAVARFGQDDADIVYIRQLVRFCRTRWGTDEAIAIASQVKLPRIPHAAQVAAREDEWSQVVPCFGWPGSPGYFFF